MGVLVGVGVDDGVTVGVLVGVDVLVAVGVNEGVSVAVAGTGIPAISAASSARYGGMASQGFGRVSDVIYK